MAARCLFRELLFAIFIGLAATTLADESEPPPKTSVLLDCAIGNGTDDAFALALAAVDPTIHLVGVTTVSGNAEDRAWIACRFLNAIGKGEIPVAFGRGTQPRFDIGAQFQYRYHPAVLYGRTAKPVQQTAVELMHDLLAKSKTKPILVCTGPLTNVAHLFAAHPDSIERVERIVFSADFVNVLADPVSAKAVFESGVRIDVMPWELGTSVQMRGGVPVRLFKRTTPLSLQLQTLYELDWSSGSHPDVATIALVSSAAGLKEAFHMTPAKTEIDETGKLAWSDADSPIRVVQRIEADQVLAWMQKQFAVGESVLPRTLANRTKPIERGGMPHRVHVFEDYETDIERRWWLAGIPCGASRHLRGMLTMDFDDKQGDTGTMYRAVIFNPVPGPPMGKNPRLSFRCWLDGTGQLRVQIYSLSNGYHRYLSLADLPQRKWLDLTVDMTAARRPDGSGGPLSENERIDDIQFYVDPRAELRIDDIVLYDAAAPDEERPFPKRILFTGWFDTGKQGQEWPGHFDILEGSGYFWKAAQSKQEKPEDRPAIRVNLRGRRPLSRTVAVDFRYKTGSPGSLNLVLKDTATLRELHGSVRETATEDWRHASVTLAPRPGQIPAQDGQDLTVADELQFVFTGKGTFLVDDLLLYEPGK